MPTLALPRARLAQSGLPAVCVVTGATEGVSNRPIRLDLQRLRYDTLVIGALGREMTYVDLSLPMTEAGRRKAVLGQVLRGTCGLLGFAGIAAGPFTLMLSYVDWRTVSRPVGWSVFLAGVVLGGGLLLLSESVLARRFRPMLLGVDEETIQVSIPSEAAARAIEEHLGLGRS